MMLGVQKKGESRRGKHRGKREREERGEGGDRERETQRIFL
jgi:hypothetical protein